MSLTEKVRTLAAKTDAQQAAAAEQAKKNADLKNRIAEAYDRREFPADFPQVDSIFIHSLHGTDASLQFKDVKPESAVKIMEAFKPVASGLFREQWVGYRTRFSLPDEWEKNPKAAFQEGDGYTLKIDRTANYPTRTRAEWTTELAPALFVRVDIDFLTIHGVTPEITARVERYPDGEIQSVRDCSIGWSIKPPFAVETVGYASGSHKSFNPFLVWAKPTGNGSPILAMVKEWASVCYQRRQHSKLAYLEDKAAGLKPEPGSVYGAAGLRSGTKAQHDCINTEEARKDAALASKHWLEYIADSDPATWPTKPSEYQKYFCHYTWACHWLQLHGLYTDPDRDNYKYGSAWL
jgi:hypothetical protein